MVTNYGKQLDKATDAKTSAAFLRRLAFWILKISGNVNAAQRLNMIAISLHNH